MTLDLRGFELGGEIGTTGEAPGAHDPVSVVLDVLGQAFGVAAEPGAPGAVEPPAAQQGRGAAS